MTYLMHQVLFCINIRICPEGAAPQSPAGVASTTLGELVVTNTNRHAVAAQATLPNDATALRLLAAHESYPGLKIVAPSGQIWPHP